MMEPLPNRVDGQSPQQGHDERDQQRQDGLFDKPDHLAPRPSTPDVLPLDHEASVSQSEPNVFGPAIDTDRPFDAGSGFGSASNDYARSQSYVPPGDHLEPPLFSRLPVPDPLQTPGFRHSPHSLAARPKAAASRRAIIPFGPSAHLYRHGMGISSSSEGALPQADIESPSTLETTGLLIGWGNAPGSVDTSTRPPHQYQLHSSYGFPEVTLDQPHAQQRAVPATHIPWSATGSAPGMVSASIDPLSGFGPSLHTLGLSPPVPGGEARTCPGELLRLSPTQRDGEPIRRVLEPGSMEQPQSITYHRSRPQHGDPTIENSHVPLIRPALNPDISTYFGPSLLVPLTQTFPLQPTNTTQEVPPTQPKHADFPRAPNLTYGSGYFDPPVNCNYNFPGRRDPGFSLDEQLSIFAPASPLVAPYNPDLRRESDPSPVTPLAQPPWGPRHRYSIANIPFRLPLKKKFVDNQVFDSNHGPYAPGSSHSVSSHQSSNMFSNLHSSGLTYTPNTTFGNDSCDQESRSAFRRYESRNASLDSGSRNRPTSLGANDSPQGSFPCHLKSSGFYPSQNEPQLNVVSDGASGSACETTSPVNFYGSLGSSNFPSNAYDGSEKEQFTSDCTNLFQSAYTFPCGFPTNPNLAMPPYAPSGSFAPKSNFSRIPNEHNIPELSLQQSDLDTHHLPQMNSEDSQQQQRTRLRRLTIMTQPSWSDHAAAGQFVQPSQNPSSPRILQSVGPSREFDNTRKRKGMKTEKLSPAPVLENSETESQNSFEKFALEGGVTVTKIADGTDGSHENKRSQSDDLVRFGGVGQGKSPYPPGLSGKSRPSDEDFEGTLDEGGEKMIPWKQDLRCDEDLYTPMWCRGQNDRKEGFCDMCEGGAWFRLKNSAYWYHKQYFHGVSSTTGHYFYPPREVKRGFSTANRQQILGMCHECAEWVGYCSIVGNQSTKKNDKVDLDNEESRSRHANDLLEIDEGGTSRIPTLWYKHAHKCHRHQTCKGAKGRKKSKKS